MYIYVDINTFKSDNDDRENDENNEKEKEEAKYDNIDKWLEQILKNPSQAEWIQYI